jgi:hypothetical protein
MKTIRMLLLLVCCMGFIHQSRAAERASIQAILITASNEPGRSDPRLSNYEPTLRRILRFASYRYMGGGSAVIDIPANGTIALGNGQHLEISTESPQGRGVRLRVEWKLGRRTLMETGLSLSPGVPAVLGGPGTGSGDEVYAVILVGR